MMLMFNLIFLFVAKLLDTYLSALKNVLMIKNKQQNQNLFFLPQKPVFSTFKSIYPRFIT